MGAAAQRAGRRTIPCVTVDRDAVLIREGSTMQRVPVLIRTATGIPVDPTTLTFTLTQLDGQVVYTETYSGVAPLSRTRRLAVGSFYFPIGDVNADPLYIREVTNSGTRLALWEYVLPDGTSGSVETSVNVLSLPYYPVLGRLRLLADKAIQQISTDIYNPLAIGFTDGMLAEYIMLGISMINEFQPPASFNLANFPVSDHTNILIQAAFYNLLTSQTMFAIATDVDSYNDINGSFAIIKHPKLAAMAAAQFALLEKLVPQFKMQFYNLNGALVEFSGRRFMLTMGGMGTPGALPVFGR